MDPPLSSSLASVLYEVSVRSTNATLQALSRTPLWQHIATYTEDQNWWYRRTEYLVSRHLDYRIGDWRSVYQSIARYGPSFKKQHDTNLLLIQVLLEIGSNPAEAEHDLAISAIMRDNIESLGLLLKDGRMKLQGSRRMPLLTAIDEGSTEAVKLLMEDGRISPEDTGNLALRNAARFGFTDIAQLLLSDPRIVAEMDEPYDTYQTPIGIAVIGNRVEIVRLLIPFVPYIEWDLIIDACKGSDTEIVRLLLQKTDRDPDLIDDCLRMARRRKRHDLELLLLSIE